MLVACLVEMVGQKAGRGERGQGEKEKKTTHREFWLGKDLPGGWGRRLPGACPLGPGLVAVPGGSSIVAGSTAMLGMVSSL